MTRPAAITAVIAACLALPAGAAAHSLVRVSGGELSYVAADATSLNSLNIHPSGGELDIRDPTVDGGMDPGPCRPGELTNDANSWIIQVFCPVGGLTRIRVSLGDREDHADLSVTLPVLLSGGFGTDTLTSGDGADTVSGDDGNDTLAGGGGNDQIAGGDGNDRMAGGAGDDVLQAGLGLDRLAGEDGSDDLRSRDGLADNVSCGGGADQVDADTFDEIADDCEGVTRVATPPPPGDWSSGDDTTRPKVQAGGRDLAEARRRRADPDRRQLERARDDRRLGVPRRGRAVAAADQQPAASERGGRRGHAHGEAQGTRAPRGAPRPAHAAARGGAPNRGRDRQRRQLRQAADAADQAARMTVRRARVTLPAASITFS